MKYPGNVQISTSIKSLQVSNFYKCLSLFLFLSVLVFLATFPYSSYATIRIQIRSIYCNWLICAFSYLFSFFNWFVQEVFFIPLWVIPQYGSCWLHPQGIIQHVPLLLASPVNWLLDLEAFWFLGKDIS